MARIDLELHVPAAFGRKSRRTKTAATCTRRGTAVQVHVRTDRPVSVAVLVLDGGQQIALAAGADGTFTGGLTLAANGSYRVALAGTDGLVSDGDTEYSSGSSKTGHQTSRKSPREAGCDQSVTPLEEVVAIEVQADDDRGIEGLELAYAVRGGVDQVVPLSIPRGGTRVKASHMLYLRISRSSRATSSPITSARGTRAARSRGATCISANQTVRTGVHGVRPGR